MRSMMVSLLGLACALSWSVAADAREPLHRLQPVRPAFKMYGTTSHLLRLNRPAVRTGFKRFGCDGNFAPRRTGVIYYGGGNYAVTYSNGAVGSMQGTRPSSPAPAGAVQTDTHNAGSSGSGGFNTPGHLVGTGG